MVRIQMSFERLKVTERVWKGKQGRATLGDKAIEADRAPFSAEETQRK